MTSKTTTVTRITKKTLGEIKKIAERDGRRITWMFDDMWRVYLEVNPNLTRKEEKDATGTKATAA